MLENRSKILGQIRHIYKQIDKLIEQIYELEEEYRKDEKENEEY